MVLRAPEPQLHHTDLHGCALNHHVPPLRLRCRTRRCRVCLVSGEAGVVLRACASGLHDHHAHNNNIAAHSSSTSNPDHHGKDDDDKNNNHDTGHNHDCSDNHHEEDDLNDAFALQLQNWSRWLAAWMACREGDLVLQAWRQFLPHSSNTQSCIAANIKTGHHLPLSSNFGPV